DVVLPFVWKKGIENRAVRRFRKDENAKAFGGIKRGLTARSQLPSSISFEARRVEHAEDVGVSQATRAGCAGSGFDGAHVRAVWICVGVVNDEVAGACRSADSQDDVFGHDAVRAVSGVAEVEGRGTETVASACGDTRAEV